ncbi:MAG: T9SS type A sorting domain-containing protein [Aureispira sp.]
MKQVYSVLFFLLLLSVSAQAQITYTGNSFPIAGDILATATTQDSTVMITPASATATAWDFSQLVATSTRRDTVQAASDGANFSDFPTTDILLPVIGNLGIAYTEVSTTAITTVGGGVEIFGLSFINAYTNTQVRQTAPLTYNSADNDDYAFRFTEHIDSVPFLRQLIDSLAGSLPVSPDSIRLTLDGTDDRLIDAWGTCALADSTYDVLRQKVTSTYTLGVEVNVDFAFIGRQWVDLTTITTLPFPTSGTVVRYDFLAENIKQPVVSLTMDSAQTSVVNIEYLDTLYAIDNAIQYLAYGIDAQVYPNPAQGHFSVQVETASLPAEGYTLRLMDALGRIVKYKTAIQEELYQVNTNDLPIGNYLLTLQDPKGRLIYRQGVAVQQ